jgi:hypothetical protein
MNRFSICLLILLAAPAALRAQWRWHSAGVGMQRGGTVYLGAGNTLNQLRQNLAPEAQPRLASIPDTLIGRSSQLNGGGEMYWSQAVTASFKHPRRHEELRLGLALQNFVQSQGFRYGQELPGRQYISHNYNLLTESRVLRLLAHYAKFTKPVFWESVRFYGAGGLDGGFSLHNRLGYNYYSSLFTDYTPSTSSNRFSGRLARLETNTDVLPAKPTYTLGASAAVGLELLLFKWHGQPFINLGAEYQMGYSQWWAGQGGASHQLTTNSVLFTLRVCRVTEPE